MNIVEVIKDTLFPVFEKYKDKVPFTYLFGSSVEGISPLSDVDIGVFISDKKEHFFDIKLSLYADFCRALKRSDIDVVILNSTKNIMLLNEIIHRGIVIYDRDFELREEFELKVLHQFIDFKEQRFAIMGI